MRMQETTTQYSGRAAVKAAVKARPGHLVNLIAVNRNAAARYLQVFNQTDGLPSGTTNFVKQWFVAPGDQICASVQNGGIPERGLVFSTGITYGWSTSPTTYTEATAADHDLFADYV